MNNFCWASQAAAEEAARLDELSAADDFREQTEQQMREEFAELLDTQAGRELLTEHFENFAAESVSGLDILIHRLISQAIVDGQHMGQGKAAMADVCDWWIEQNIKQRVADRLSDMRER